MGVSIPFLHCVVIFLPNFLAVFQNNMLVSAQNQFVSNELLALNDNLSEHGITLSKADCNGIAEFRAEALAENERIEVGLGATKRIIEEFSDSGYVNQQNFREVVEALLECFYTIKTETDDKVSDDEVMDFLKYLFETESGGDIGKLYESEAFDMFVAGKFSPGTECDNDGEPDSEQEY